MFWILLLAVLGVVVYSAWKSTQLAPTIKLGKSAKEAIEQSKAALEKVANVSQNTEVEPVKKAAPKVRKKYGGKVKKEKK